ncbi:MAG: hypothetical protein ABEJ82_00560 [Haloplanus sp.]
MTDSRDVVSVLVALNFVVVAAFLLVVGPFDAVAPVVPLLLVLLLALVLYRF